MLQTLHLPTQIAPPANRAGPRSQKSSLQRPHANKLGPYPKSLSSTQVFLSHCTQPQPPLLQPVPLRNFHPPAHSFLCSWASLCTPRETRHELSHLAMLPLLSSHTPCLFVSLCFSQPLSSPQHPPILFDQALSRLESREGRERRGKAGKRKSGWELQCGQDESGPQFLFCCRYFYPPCP